MVEVASRGVDEYGALRTRALATVGTQVKWVTDTFVKGATYPIAGAGIWLCTRKKGHARGEVNHVIIAGIALLRRLCSLPTTKYMNAYTHTVC